MFRAMRLADILDMRGNPHNEATAFHLALKHAGRLFARPVSRPAIIGTAFDVEPGVRQRSKTGSEIAPRANLG
jgi:hypothetical protein